MSEAEIVARLIVAREGTDVDENINKVIAWLCEEYFDRCVAGTTDPSLMELAQDLLDGRIERGVKLKGAKS